MWLSASSRYLSHQLVISAWRRKPVVLLTILGITLFVLFVQYSQVAGGPSERAPAGAVKLLPQQHQQRQQSLSGGGQHQQLQRPASGHRASQHPEDFQHLNDAHLLTQNGINRLPHSSRDDSSRVGRRDKSEHGTNYVIHESPMKNKDRDSNVPGMPHGAAAALESKAQVPSEVRESAAGRHGDGSAATFREGYPSAALPEPEAAPAPTAPLHRVVHFDLKGAPPKISYIKKVLPIIKEAGATGIMLEYEDMFPYNGSLDIIRAGNAYDPNQLDDLLRYITVDLKLHLIPLIQTFGHMEFVLKFEKFRRLREVDEFPAVVCPSKDESMKVIREMAKQIMSFHAKYRIKYLHIGCDEVFHLGECGLCMGKPKDELLLGHMAQVAEYVRKELHVIPLVWDDMLRNYSPDQLKRYNLQNLVEPMVWTYVKDVYRFIPYSNWATFGEVFPHIWAASAFKGAFGETLTVPSAKGHLENNMAWIDVIQEQKDKFRLFRGLVITGWQRYDHFATLAETFPAGFPSLILNLAAVTAGGFLGNEDAVRAAVSKLLNCHDSLRQLDLESDEFMWSSAGRCFFPGAAVFRMTENHRDTIKRANEYFDGVTVHKAWLTPYNVRRNYTFIDRIDQGLEEYSSVYFGVTALISQAKEALREVFDEFTVAEWIEQNIYPTLLKLERLKADAESMRNARTWPKRPLPIEPNLQRFDIGRQEL